MRQLAAALGLLVMAALGLGAGCAAEPGTIAAGCGEQAEVSDAVKAEWVAGGASPVTCWRRTMCTGDERFMGIEVSCFASGECHCGRALPAADGTIEWSEFGPLCKETSGACDIDTGCCASAFFRD